MCEKGACVKKREFCTRGFFTHTRHFTHALYTHADFSHTLFTHTHISHAHPTHTRRFTHAHCTHTHAVLHTHVTHTHRKKHTHTPKKTSWFVVQWVWCQQSASVYKHYLTAERLFCCMIHKQTDKYRLPSCFLIILQ